MSKALKKTKQNFFSKLFKSISSKSVVDDQVLDSIEEALVSADVGVDTTIKIIDKLEEVVKERRYNSVEEVYEFLREAIVQIIESHDAKHAQTSSSPAKVTMVVGINGVGKTTSIAKMANYFKNQGKKVILGAADTFRAAAVDQLTVWSERLDVPIVKQQMGADPSSVTFDTVQAAISREVDMAIIDTAGRLHNKVNLMKELTKMKKSIHKADPDIEVDVILVLDGSTGQNALIQAKQFIDTTEVDGLIITKLDGTAKGGVVLGIMDQLNIPVRFIGTGEQVGDFEIFDPEKFVNTFFEEERD